MKNLRNEIALTSTEYNACLAIRWCRKLSLFYKIFKENKPVYLFNLIPTINSNCNTRNTDKITLFRAKHNFFKNPFFPSSYLMEQARS